MTLELISKYMCFNSI